MITSIKTLLFQKAAFNTVFALQNNLCEFDNTYTNSKGYFVVVIKNGF